MAPNRCHSNVTNFAFMLVLMTSALILTGTEAFRTIDLRSGPKDGPPTKPEHFRSAEDLNKYLSDLTEYYTVLGRPR